MWGSPSAHGGRHCDDGEHRDGFVIGTAGGEEVALSFDDV